VEYIAMHSLLDRNNPIYEVDDVDEVGEISGWKESKFQLMPTATLRIFISLRSTSDDDHIQSPPVSNHKVCLGSTHIYAAAGPGHKRHIRTLSAL
jgi:hypothetical protein